MSKKLIVTLSIVLCAISVVLILFWTLFGLATVTVEFSSTIENLTVSQDEIVKAGNFRYGACVLFEGKKKSVKAINNHVSKNENFAYLRVVNIETVFPNKFVIHVAEREELFAVEQGEDKPYLVCDRDFRVLRMVQTFESTSENAILLKGLKFSNTDVKIGDFLQIEQKAMAKFHSNMLANNRDLAQQVGKFKQLTLIDEEGILSLQLTTFQGREMKICNIDFAFSAKIQKLFAAESALLSQQTDEDGNFVNANGETIFLMLSESGEYVPYDESADLPKVAFSVELLSHCMLKVDNLTLDGVVKRTEKDVYYSLVEMN